MGGDRIGSGVGGLLLLGEWVIDGWWMVEMEVEADDMSDVGAIIYLKIFKKGK